MVDSATKTSGSSPGILSQTLHMITEKAEKLVEDVEVFFHKERTFGLVFLSIVIAIILSYKLKNE